MTHRRHNRLDHDTHSMTDPVFMNIEPEKPKMAPSAIAEMVLSFFSGLCIERNLKSGKTSSNRKIENFMTAVRSR
jgi:hypothetical protein